MIEMFGKDDRSYHLKRVFEWITYQYPNILAFESSNINCSDRGADDGYWGHLRCPGGSNMCPGGVWIKTRLHYPGILHKM